MSGTFDVSGVQRLAGGWQITRRFSPGEEQAVAPTPGGVSAVHSYAFTDVDLVNGQLTGGTLAAEGDSQYLSNPDGTFELVGIGNVGGSSVSERLAQGRYISPDGGHVIFSTGREPTGSFRCFEAAKGGNVAKCPVHRLADNAPPEGTGAVYDRAAAGGTKVISLLPGDEPPLAGQDAAYQGASKDGSTVAFKIGATLYVRTADSGDGTTLEVAGGDPVYAGLSSNGQYLFYVAGGESGDIHRFDTGNDIDEQVNATGDGQVVNVSADGSHVYFISEQQIGGHGTAAQPNLYVWTAGGAVSFIATVVPSDLKQTSIPEETVGYPALTNWTDWAVSPETGEEQGPGADSSRATPDGRTLIFESRAQLTSYDNTEVSAAACGDPENAGEGCTEIYRWDAAAGVTCVSCNPLSKPASADARLQQLNLVRAPVVLHNLSDDGSRVFFETKEALVSGDAGSVNDIYEWHQEVGGSPEVSLLSSGHSQEYPPLLNVRASQPKPNVIFAITPTGSDVAFLSQDELVPGAGSGGTPGLYDARVDGGFALPPALAPCLEEGCRSAFGSQPTFALPSSETLAGAGNVKPRKPHQCRHGKKNAKQPNCHKNKSKKNAKASISAAGGESSDPSASHTAAQGSDGATPATTPGLAGGPSSTTSATSGEFSEFGIESVKAKLSTTAASAHPDFITRIALNHFVEKGLPVAVARTENISVKLPPGLLGNPNAVPECSTGEFLVYANCPIDSQVGIVKAAIFGLQELNWPLYNLEPAHPDREVARFGFYPAVPVFIDVQVRTASDFGVTASVHRGPGASSLILAETIIWANPANPEHDEQRLTTLETTKACGSTGTACEAPGGKRESGIPAPERKALLTNPSACQEGSVGFEVTSYQLPGQSFTASAPLAPITDCTGLPFAPSFEADPTSHEAGAPTGLHTVLKFPQHLGEDERATATMREARVTLPAGMQIAAGAANWIGTCSEEEVGFHKEVDTNCPDNSKLGTATILSPALSVPIEGTIYQRSPQPGHQFGLWLTADALGLHVKLPGELEPDKSTGRLTAVFRDLPQVPVEEIDLNVWGGPRAPLQNPDHCGAFTTDFSFAPHSNDPAAAGQSTMQITEGCSQGFSPTLNAGVSEPTAGKFSPFVFDLTRGDGQQALRGFELRLPNGELAKIKGVPLCPEDAAAAATCPEGSRIGSLTATTGPGPDPFTIPEPGKATPRIFLAGPYQGAPFSIVSQVPAQAGPFDLGTLAVRSGLDVEPESGRAVVKADPLPQFFEGVGIAYRNLHAVIDRPEFSLNPTNCSELQVAADVTSTQGTVAHPSARFQVDGCKALKFKPKLTLKLTGGTKRADYPALSAELKARKGDANIAFTSVALPHSEFLAQEHIGTICTRKQFAADKCPKGSVYGKAKAISPLLDKPLSGPVYLRSSNHLLPDLVAKLGGQLEIDLVGRIDSKNGGIRATFESVPDAPVSKFVLQMKGGAKSLLTNSTDICRGSHKATVAMRAQNGRRVDLRPNLVSPGCGKKKLGKHKQN